MARYNTSIAPSSMAPTISRRLYNALAFGMVTISFLIMWGAYLLVDRGTIFEALAGAGSFGVIALLVGSLAGSIGGMILMSRGKTKQNIGMTLAGYGLFSITFGFTVALALQQYTTITIAYAFGITACISGIFLVAGVTFPEIFSRILPILTVSLLAVVLVEIVAVVFFHANQTIFDYLVIAIFCGFLGYDSYALAADSPTVPNAIWHASQIYVDIANILIRVLDLMDNR